MVDPGEFLRTVELFAALEPTALTEVRATARVRNVEAGGAFFREQDPATAFFVLAAGSVKLAQLTPEGHQIVLRLIGPADPFGGASAFGATTYPITAEAVTDSCALEWPGGVMAGPRLDDVDSVFKVRSRISSTFSGNLADYVRCTRYLEIIHAEDLLQNAARQGEYFLERTRELAKMNKKVDNARGRGLLVAFDAPDRDARDEIVRLAREEESLLILPCGDRSVRLRPALDITLEDAREGMDRLERTVKRVLS